MTTVAPVLDERTPSSTQLRIFAALSLLYIAVTAAILPWLGDPAPADPKIVLAYGGGILFADLCTALLLGALYRKNGRSAFLVLTCAYLFGGLMALAHIVTFPGALFPQPPIGNQQTGAWLYLAWRLGMALLFFGAVLRAGRAEAPFSERLDLRLVAACGLTLAAAALAFSLAAYLDLEHLLGLTLGTLAEPVQWIAVGVCALCVPVIWLRRAFNDVLYLWLGLVLVASIVDLTLSNLAGAPFTVGWHASRASFVVSACLLLAFLLGDVANRGGRLSRLSVVAAYGGAAAITMAAVFLRWFLDPWMGLSVPYVTLYGAVAVAVWFGGVGPASLAMALGYVLVNVRYVAPAGRVAINDVSDVMALVLFALSCSLIIILGEAMRRARDRYRISQIELHDQATALARADAKKSEFLAVLSHELRNPLAPLRTGLALLKMRNVDTATAETHEMMDRQIGQLTRLIDDLLDVSRIDRGKLEMKSERVAVDALIRSAVDTAKPNIDVQGHALEVRYPPASVQVQGDAVRLAQVVSNLLNNAAKFTPPGGRIELSARAQGGRVLLRVLDTGIGIAPEKLEEVFEMFVQLDDRKATAAGGLGLGLTLARSIVERHGGTLKARSAGVGKGAEFIVDLPLAPAAQAPAPAPAQPG
ncbi:MAG TPA: ATP-binding protein, partial [Burkholderiales bacterium]